MSEPERYGTCSDGNGHWGIEDEGKVILSGLVSHDACDAVMDILDERDALKAEIERLTKAGDWKPIHTAPKDGTDVLIAYRDGYFGCMAVTLTCWGETSWRHLFANEYLMDTPTYWMPVPLAPADEGNPNA